MSFSKHCNLCEYERTSLEKGLICKLTSRNPDFKNTCPSIKLGKRFQKKLEITNIKLELLDRNKKATHLSFYFMIVIGFLLIIIGSSLSDWRIASIFLWTVKTAIILAGITFLLSAYTKLNGFRKKYKIATIEKFKIDETLNKYDIEYHPKFEFKEKVHGIQEVIVEIDFKNWTKKHTSTSYKIDL